MPNPTDPDRAGKQIDHRTDALWRSAAEGAGTKPSWTEWISGGSFLADTASGAASAAPGLATDQAKETATEWVTAKAAEKAAKVTLLATLQGLSGTWLVTVGGMVGMAAADAVMKRIDDKYKVSEKVQSATSEALDRVQRYRYGGSSNARQLLTGTDAQGRSVEDVFKSFKENAGFLQDLLNRLAGKAGSAYYCDDAYQIAAGAQKAAGVKASLEADIAGLKALLGELETELGNIDMEAINRQAKDVAKTIAAVGDGRHWANTWGSTALAFRRCSSQHCYGPPT